jgi:hypothetical protein
MDRWGLWGASLISVCVFTLVITPLVGVRPDPINLTITFSAVGLGSLLVFWSFLAGKKPPPADSCERRGVHHSRCRCAAKTRMQSGEQR